MRSSASRRAETLACNPCSARRGTRPSPHRYVIGQDEAKRALAVAVCDHYNFARRCLAEPALAESHHVKPNVLLLGPSGVGKT